MIYSNDATVKTIDPNGTDHIWLAGVDVGEGDTIESDGTIASFIVLIALSANNWTSFGSKGTWADSNP